jgi:hypothetical protein
MRTTEQEISFLRSEVKWRDERITRLEELQADLAGEVDRLWHEDLSCPQCGTAVERAEPLLK